MKVLTSSQHDCRPRPWGSPSEARGSHCGAAWSVTGSPQFILKETLGLICWGHNLGPLASPAPEHVTSPWQWARHTTSLEGDVNFYAS